jgi:hypothetical protein
MSFPSVAVLVGSPAFAVPPGAGGCGGFFSRRSSRVCGVGSWGAGQGYDSFPGRFVFGAARPGKARPGVAGRGMARQGKHTAAPKGPLQFGEARLGAAWHGEARRGEAGQHTVPLGTEDFKNYERTNNG